MSKVFKPRRGSADQVAAFIGEANEVILNTTTNTLHVMDGLTAGGFPLAKVADLNTFKASQSAKDAAQDAAISAAQSSADEALAQAGEFIELLDGKAGVNAENFTTEGKSLLAGLGMPGEGSIELVFGASGASYSVEDADGWLFAFINTTNSAGAKLDMCYTGGAAGISTMRNNAGIIRAFLPLRKGVACSIAYANASEKHLYFVPVVGGAE